MRKLLFFLLAFVISTSCVFADTELPDDSQPIQDIESTTTPVVVDITQLLTNNNESKEEKDEVIKVDELEPVLVNVETELRSVTPSNSNGFKAVILGIIGNYDTVVTDYTYQSYNGSTSHSIQIERDYAWIASCCVFALCLYCTYRAIGGIVSRF